MKIQKIIIEGFHNVTRKEYEFEDINYIHGRNGAGKSTILQAIQLGLLGYVPGSNKTKQGVFAHSNNHTMAVKLILDNGVSIQRVWTKSKTSVTESVTTIPDGYEIDSLIKDLELPLFNFDEFSHMTANGLKDWFINYLPKQSFTTDWSNVLKEAMSDRPSEMIDEDLLNECIETIRQFNLSGVEEIRRANDYFKTLLSFNKKELERKISTIQSLIHYDDYVEEYSEEDLKSKINEIEQRLIAIRANALKISILEEKIQQLNSYKSMLPELKKLEGYAKNWKSAGDEASTKVESLKNRHRVIYGQYKSLEDIINSNGICTFTSKRCAEITALIEGYKTQVEDLKKEEAEILAEVSRLNTYVSECRDSYTATISKYQTIRRDTDTIPQLEHEIETLQSDIPSNTDSDISTLESDLEKYKEMYGKAVANRQYNELNSVVLNDRYRLENVVECLKAWVKLTDVNGLQAQGDYNPFEVLSSSIDEVLVSVFKTDVKSTFYSEGKANSFSFGIQRNNTYVPYQMLSSGEKCLFLLSMFIGLLKYTKSPLKVIMIDDLLDHLDDANFDSALETIKQMKDIQFIFAGVKPSTVENFHCIEI